MIDSRLEDAFALRTDEMILNSGYHWEEEKVAHGTIVWEIWYQFLVEV